MKGKMVIIDTNSGSLEQRATQNVYYHLRARFYDTGEALRNVRNIVAHQLITIDELYPYLIKEKEKFVYSFVEEEYKPVLDNWIKQNNFQNVLNFLLPVISIEINKLQVSILNY